jgi:anti-sigma B factor antagonist
MPLQIDQRPSGDAMILDLHGTITAGDGSIVEAIRALTARGSRHMVLNLADVSYMDSVGLSALMRAYLMLRHDGGRLVLLHAPRQIAALFTATRLDVIFDMFYDEAAAVQSVTSSDPVRLVGSQA